MAVRFNLWLMCCVLSAASGKTWAADLLQARGVEIASAVAAQSQSGPVSPWSKLKIESDGITMTDKRLVLSDGGLPGQISIHEENLLREPISVEMADGIFAVADKASQTSWTLSATGDHATSSNELTALVNGRTLRLGLRTDVWFDGLMTFQFSIPNFPESLQDKSIRYRIPLADGLASFMHQPAPVGKRNLALDTSKENLAFPFVPFLWLGNDSRGLFWLSESTLGWKNASDKQAMQLLRDGKSWVLEINIRPQISRDGTWRHSFGLMPTPVKDLPTNWRTMRMLPAKGGSAYVMWPNEKEIGAPYFGYPMSRKQTQFSSIVGDLKKSGVTALPYACPTWFATQAPEWRLHEREWRAGVSDRTFTGSEWGGEFVNVCPARSSWKEFVNERFGAFIKQYKLTGLYMDNAQVYATTNCLNVDAAPGYIEYPMLDQRESYRTIVASLRANSRNTFALVHSSGGLNLPTFSAVDAWVSGEQYRDVVKDDYLDVASLTDFRVELNAAHWGIVPFFLPEFSEEMAKTVIPTRKLMSILLLHDVTPWPQWANVNEINRGLAMLDKFGVRDAKFVPYYSAKPLATVSKPRVYVSGYRLDNRKLLIVSNLGKAAADGQLCIEATGSAASQALHSWPEFKALPLRDSCTSITIPAGSYQMYCADCNFGSGG
jgi:hypothetical protein